MARSTTITAFGTIWNGEGCLRKRDATRRSYPASMRLRDPIWSNIWRGCLPSPSLTVTRAMSAWRAIGSAKSPYWTRVGDGIAFASTLDALIELLPQRPDLDPRAIAEYLVLQYVPGSHSPWQGIEKLEPGTWLRLHAGVIEKERYWSPRSLSRIARSTGQRRGSIYGSGSGPRSKLGSRARCRWGCS